MSALTNGLLTLFARREPTADPVDKTLGLAHKKDVVLYSDRECTKRACVIPWHFSGLPRRNSKFVMFNCWRWNLEWAI